MPHISGCALVREVRELRRKMPILLMSGYGGGGLMERALEAGADDVLKKPLSAHDLATGLARVLQK
jgi:FixJ family two-component response regulator